MKWVRVINNIIIEEIPSGNTPVEDWYGEDFAAQCEEVKNEVQVGWVKYKNKFISSEEYYEATLTYEQVDHEVVAKIRERYTVDDEYKMLRLGVLDPEDEEFLAYNDYVEECREWGRERKKHIDPNEQEV